MRTCHRARALVAVASLALGGCQSHGGAASKNDPAVQKAGGKTAPITITIADSQQSTEPSSGPLAEFAAEVASLSNGSMIAKVAYDASANDATDPGSDKPIITGLQAGDFQMAVVPARAWSFAGVSSLQALQAPFLVQSDDQMNAIVGDKGIVASLFAGLDAVGVTGMTIFPESLRHFFSLTTPILTPADVKGRQIRAISSPDVARIFSTLGATPVDPSFEAFSTGVFDGTITATEAGFDIALTAIPRPATATGNLVLYPKMITLVANSRFWDGLNDQQRIELMTAAQKAQAVAIAHRVSDAELAARYCGNGGTVVLTDAKSVADFRSAAEPLYAELEQNSDTRRTIAAIDALSRGTQPAPVTACTPAETSAPKDLVAKGGNLPNGVYRVEYTDEYLRAAGLNAELVHENHGVYTYRLQDGHWSFHQDAENLHFPDHGDGIYQVEGSTLYWKWDANMGGSTFSFKWSVDGDGSLHFTQIDVVSEPDWIFQLPWPRIGDL